MSDLDNITHSGKWSSRLSVISTIAIATATIVIAVATVANYYSTKSSLKIAEKQISVTQGQISITRQIFESSNRPYVGFFKADIVHDYIDGKKSLIFNLWYSNKGNLPSTETISRCFVYINNEKRDVGDNFEGIPYILSPGEKNYFRRVFQKEMMNQIQKGDTKLIFYMKFDYKNEFGKKYKSEQAVMYNYKTKGLTPIYGKYGGK